MQASNKNTGSFILLCSLALFALLFAGSYPFLKYYIDPDAVNYITISKRYASGDYVRAVNGMWSPFSCWLNALFIKGGTDALRAAHISNALACVSVISVGFILLKRFVEDRFIIWMLMLALPIALLDNLYEQLFDDLWQVFFLLCYLLLISSKNFLQLWWKWLICGIIAAFAYFAKAYSFYFILLHLPVSVFVLSKKEGKTLGANIKVLVVAFVTMLVLMAPWLNALHSKYGTWTLTKASSVNASWTLLGHKNFKEGITHLIPPPYDNSPWNMEDPTFSQGPLHTAWENPKMMVSQIAHSGYALVQGLFVMNEISILLFVVLLASDIVIFSKKEQNLFGSGHKILLWAALIMPMGYLLQHFESRYIWLMGYMGMVLGAAWLMQLKEYVTLRSYRFLVFAFAFSYVVFPVYDLKGLINKGRPRYEEAMQIKQLGIHGSFTSNGDCLWEGVTALISEMPYYTIEHFDFDKKELLAEMHRYHVNYYFFHYAKPEDCSTIFCDDEGKPFPEVTSGRIEGLRIYRVE